MVFFSIFAVYLVIMQAKDAVHFPVSAKTDWVVVWCLCQVLICTLLLQCALQLDGGEPSSSL